MQGLTDELSWFSDVLQIIAFFVVLPLGALPRETKTRLWDTMARAGRTKYWQTVASLCGLVKEHADEHEPYPSEISLYEHAEQAEQYQHDGESFP